MIVSWGTGSMHKKCDTDLASVVNTEARKIAEDLCIDNRVQVMSNTLAFITLKDHKHNFEKDNFEEYK